MSIFALLADCMFVDIVILRMALSCGIIDMKNNVEFNNVYFVAQYIPRIMNKVSIYTALYSVMVC